MTPFKTRCRVIYGDTDKMGVAYYANYFRWFEMGRTEVFRAWGLAYKELELKGIFLPVSEAHCKYMSPAQYDEVLTIETTLDTGIKGGLKFDYRIIGEDGKTILARGHTIHAFMNGNGRVIRPPDFFKKLIQANCSA